MGSPDQQAVRSNIEAVREATNRLEAAVDKAMTDGGTEAFAASSRLPNWTVGHVVTHLARNADGLRRVLVGATVGEKLQPYASPRARDGDIQAGALRCAETIASDFRAANQEFAETVDALPPAVWSESVDLGRGGVTTADVILVARLAEVEMHHHDLGIDAGLGLLNGPQANRLLAALQRSYIRTRDVSGLTLIPDGAAAITIGTGGPQVAGAATDLVGWLSGRTDGSLLRTAGPLPELPSW